MEILNKLGFKEEEITETNAKLQELGVSDEAKAYINSLGSKIEDMSFKGGYNSAMTTVEEASVKLFGIQKDDKEMKATDFISHAFSKKLESEKSALSAKIEDYEQKLKDKGFNTEEIESKVKEEFKGTIETLNSEVEKYKTELSEFKQKQIEAENKNTVKKYLLPLEDEKDELAMRELDRFVNDLISNSSNNIEVINGEAYFKDEFGKNVSIKEAQANDKFLSRFLKKETEINGEKGKLRINIENNGAGYARFNHLEGQDKVNAVTEHVSKDRSIAKNPLLFRKEVAKYMSS
jgi:hypothetical protein